MKEEIPVGEFNERTEMGSRVNTKQKMAALNVAGRSPRVMIAIILGSLVVAAGTAAYLDIADSPHRTFTNRKSTRNNVLQSNQSVQRTGQPLL